MSRLPSRVVASWATYDFANSAFNTLISTFVYSTFFASFIAPDGISGTELWGMAAGLSGLLVAVLSPVAGAMADLGGYRHRLLISCSVVAALGAAALYFPLKGDVTLALTIFLIANTAFELSFVFYNAYLPEIVSADRIGRVSGWGWALGFAGGLGCLAVGYLIFLMPESPPFGLDADTGQHIRITNVLVAGWYLLFALPAFIYLPRSERTSRAPLSSHLRGTFRRLASTFAHVRSFRNTFWLLVARIFYNDALTTIIALGGIYAKITFGFTFGELFLFAIVLNVAAGIGALLFGWVDDAIGGKATVLITIVGLCLGTTIALLGTTKVTIWIAGGVIGIFMGPNQAASRSLMGRFIPAGHQSEFFGFYAFSGKATAIIGPVAFGQLTAAFDSQRAGVAFILALFLVGGLILWLTVDEREGVRAVQHPAAPET